MVWKKISVRGHPETAETEQIPPKGPGDRVMEQRLKYDRDIRTSGNVDALLSNEMCFTWNNNTVSVMEEDFLSENNIPFKKILAIKIVILLLVLLLFTRF